MGLKILFVSSYFPPEVGPAASRVGSLTKFFASMGCQVEVLTCNPRYPRDFKFEDFHGKPASYESHGAKAIVFQVPAAKFNALYRLSEEVRFYTRGVKLTPSLTVPDVVIGTSPFFSSACLAFTLSRRFNRPFIYDIRDLYPENLRIANLPVPSFIYSYFDSWANRMYQGASRIIVNQPSLLRNLSKRMPSGKIDIVMNPLGEIPSNFVRKTPTRSAPVTVGYAGAWGRGYDFSTYLEVVKEADPELFRFRLIGSGIWRRKIESFCGSGKSKLSVYHGWLRGNELVKEYAEWGIGIVPVSPAWTDTLWPSKITELLAYGITVVVPPELPLTPLLEKMPLLIRAKTSTSEGYLDALLRAREVYLDTLTQDYSRYVQMIKEAYDPKRLGEAYYRIILEAVETFPEKAYQASNVGRKVDAPSSDNW